jgi:hypothetical protein
VQRIRANFGGWGRKSYDFRYGREEAGRGGSPMGPLTLALSPGGGAWEWRTGAATWMGTYAGRRVFGIAMRVGRDDKASGMAGTGMVSDRTLRLIKLLEDESEEIRTGVREQLGGMEEELTLLLEGAESDLNVTQRRVVLGILRDRSREWFEAHWGDWQRLQGEPVRLEAGMMCLSEYLGPAGRRGTRKLTESLDKLADDCREHGADRTPSSLVAYLFGEGGAFGANTEDFYDPKNFDLAWVIESGKGNHLSLACLVVMVGRRVGIKIDGCDYPGRFMARYVEGREIWLIDACHGGELIPGVEVAEERPVAGAEVREIIARPATARTTLRRALEELETALLRKGYPHDAGAVRNCLQSMIAV